MAKEYKRTERIPEEVDVLTQWLHAQLEQELARCLQKYPNFQPIMPLVQAALEMQPEDLPPASTEPETEAGQDWPGQARERLKQGMTLDETGFCLAPSRVGPWLVSLAQKLETRDATSARAITGLGEHLSNLAGGNGDDAADGREKWENRAQAWTGFQLASRASGLEQGLTTFLYVLTLSRFYAARGQSLVHNVDLSVWRRGNCPVCSAYPHYGLLDEDTGAKMLECWMCGIRWPHPRIQCPFCGHDHPDDLGFFTVEGDHACRVHFCRQCQAYYKVFDLREEAQKEALLLVHHMATLSRDYYARREGFQPGSGLEWIDFTKVGGADS